MDRSYLANRLRRAGQKLTNGAWRLLSNRAIDAYWYTNETNFGDLLTPLLLRHFGMRPLFCPYPSHASLVCVGSVLQMVPDTYRGLVLGSGLIWADDTARLPHATILALRGELTKHCLGVTAPVALGDPGLLVADLVAKPRSPQRYTLGIVAHYLDKHHEAIRSLAERYPDDVRVIDVQRRPMPVVREIAQCRHILSSSLHGVIVADALGIPSSWTILSGKLKGGGFKFRDYYSAFGAERGPVAVPEGTPLSAIVDATQPPPRQLPEVQAGLRAAFAALLECYKGLTMAAGANGAPVESGSPHL